MENKRLNIEHLVFQAKNKMTIACRYDECGGRVVEISHDARGEDEFARVEQLIADEAPYDKLDAPVVSLTGINLRQDYPWLDVVMTVCAMAKTITHILNQDTGKPIAQGAGWIYAIAEVLGETNE